MSKYMDTYIKNVLMTADIVQICESEIILFYSRESGKEKW